MGALSARFARTVIAVTLVPALTAAAPLAAAAAGVSAAAAAAAASTSRPHKFVPPKVAKVPVLPRVALPVAASSTLARRRVAQATAAELRAGAGPRPDSAWPTAGSAVAVLPVMPSRPTAAGLSAADAAVPAGALPVTVARAGTQSAPLSRVSVSLLDHAVAARAGQTAVLFLVGETGTARGTVTVTLRYGSFRNAVGADWAYRLRLAELPACALTTPRVRACQVPVPLRTVNDTRAGTLSATVTMTEPVRPASFLSATPRPLAAPEIPSAQALLTPVSGPSGSNGDFTVSSLSPAGTWTGGGASGDFTWSYPITLPPSAAGTPPQLALGYDSSSVDGRTAQTNNQFGMVGEGFSLSDNFIERSYTDCADDPEGAISGMYDQCWAGNVVTLSLNGKSTPLVIDSSGNWHEQNDSGDLVQYETGTAANTNNGTHDNGYWVVTTPDGTQYFFGKNEGPGWASGDPVTNSAWTEPVYGAHTGDPCYSSSGFASSSCSQAWRWNLDFVIDPNGNTTAYYYAKETNYYGADGRTTGVQYVRSGYLTQIQYGLRDEGGNIYTPAADKNPPDEVTFHADQRCIPASSFDCAASKFTTANAADWPDTPVDQACASGATCSNHAPTFWSQLRIDSITTQYYNGSGYTKVDTYALGQSFPTSGDPELELDTITRTGYTAAGASLMLPPVDLTYQLMDNRILGYNGEPAMAHWRILNIESETGEVINVAFSTKCAASDIPSDPSANTTLCYPISWTPAGDTKPILDYFNKYVVKAVTVEDGTAGSPSHVTNYVYVGSPAWHYDDNMLVKSKYRTYGQFRGYGSVQTLTGNPQNNTNGVADAATETETTYYRGLSDDNNTTTVNVADSLGETFNDADALAGMPLEVQTFNGSGGAQLTDTITEWGVLQTTGTQTLNGVTLTAAMTGVTSERDYTDLANGNQNQLTTATTYDTDGRAMLVDKSGTGIPGTCTQNTYDDNTSTSVWIRDAVSEKIVAQQACPSSPGSLTPADIISDTRTFYDGATSLTTPPTAGNPTEEDDATKNTGGTLTWLAPAWTKTYDSAGRVTKSTDGKGNPTSTAYTPSDGGPLTKTVITNALSQTTTTTFDPGRGSLLTVTDPAGYETSGSYDALGRLTALWKPGRSQAGGATANLTYAYQELQSKPLAVTTNTLVDAGGGSTDYVTSISIYDSLGQLRQVQTAAEGGVTTVSSTLYDSHGWTAETDSHYTVSGSPSTALASAATAAMGTRAVYSYDGDGRIVDQQNYTGTTLTDSVQTVQGGNQVTAIKHDPSGVVIGTPTAVLTNVLGQTTQTIQYSGAPTVSPAGVVSGGGPQSTTYGYDAGGNQVKITDPSSNVWTYAYDLLGRQVSALDPDSGSTTTWYDNAGNVAYSTDANGITVNFTYDALNRKTAEYTGSTTQGSGTKVATWVWDTLKKGQLSYETSITSKGTYEDGNLGYDAEGNVNGTWVTVPSGQPLAGTYETGYTYSTTGQLLAETPASGGGLPVDSLSWTYDPYGNPTSEKGYDTYVNNATWTPYHELAQADLGTGNSAAALTYTYDTETRAINSVNLSDNQPSPQVDNTAYTYNADHQITSVTDTQGAQGSAPVETQCFTYDGLSRLTEAWTATDNCAANPATAGNATVNGPQPYWQSWSFDPIGDITSQVDHATAGTSTGDTTLSYNYGSAAHAHAVQSVTISNSATNSSSTTSFGYDADGNMNNLGGTAANWNYNGTPATIGSTSYTYDADGNELTETNSAGTTVFLPGEQITSNGTATTGMRYYAFGGMMIGETNGSNLYWTEANLQGTLITAVNAFSESSPVIFRTTTPYGTMVSGTGAPAWPDGRTFLNDYANPDTGLVDIGARKYDPALGLFISVDPVLDASDPQTMTGYTYAAGDPVNSADPSGKMLCEVGGPCGSVQSLEQYNETQQLQQDAQNLAAVVFALGYQQRYQGTPAGIAYDKFTNASVAAYYKGKHLSDVQQFAVANYENDSGVVYPDPVGNAVIDTIATLAAAPLADLADAAISGIRGLFESEADAGFGDLSRAEEFGIKPYQSLTQNLKGLGLQAHHLIEKRFATIVGEKAGEMLSVAVTPEEHGVFTAAWRALIPYGASGTGQATASQITSAAQQIYANYPAILEALGLSS